MAHKIQDLIKVTPGTKTRSLADSAVAAPKRKKRKDDNEAIILYDAFFFREVEADATYHDDTLHADIWRVDGKFLIDIDYGRRLTVMSYDLDDNPAAVGLDPVDDFSTWLMLWMKSEGLTD